MSDVETPKYKILRTEETIEIRKYSPLIIAEVLVNGDRKSAIGDGFRILADYIFGRNDINTKIEMTAPVSQQSNRKIQMTAPIQQKGQGRSWKISFVMPSTFSLDNLPVPIDKRIEIKPISEKVYAVLRFSGLNSDDNIASHEAELKKFLIQKNIPSHDLPLYAFYNPPWTLPFMRRNEILIEISQ